MFFDAVKEDHTFENRLLEAALLQRRLLELRFDFGKMEPRPLEERRKGLFGRETVFPEAYSRLLQELEAKRVELERLRSEKGYPRGLYWWNIPWEDLIPILLQNLTLPEEEDEPDESGWRRAYGLVRMEGREDRDLLCLRVQGYWQGKLSTSKSTYERELSSYTKAERRRMEEEYESRKNNKALTHMAFANNVGVHSIDTGMDYNTAVDYYSSAEYLSNRMREAENYSQSLYTLVETKALSVSAHGKRYGAVDAVAEYHVDGEGRLDYMAMLDFARIAASGEAPEEQGSLLEHKDAAVLCALWLSRRDEVRSVPVRLLGKELNRCAASYEEALIQAQMITCLAGKLEGE